MSEKQQIDRKQSLIGQWDDQKEWKNEIYSMWQEVFQDPEAFVQYYYSTMYEKNRVYMIWGNEQEKSLLETKQEVTGQQQGIEQKLCGMIHLNPYEMKVQDETMEIDYIVGVAVDETMRRRGIMRSMLKTTMEEMRKKKMPFTFLMPAKEAYYTPFDFRFVYERAIWNIQIDSLLPITVEGEVVEVLPCTEEQEMALIEFCHDFWQQFMIAPVRTKEYWKQMKEELLAEQGEILLIKKQGMLCGYMTYVLEEQQMVIREIVTKESIEAIIQTFATKKQVSQFKVYTDWFHDIEQLKKRIGNDCKQEMKRVPMIMFRILDIEAMLTKVRSTKECSMTFSLIDEFLPDNTGVYRWTVGTTNAILEKVSQEEVDTVLTIAELTEHLFGYKKNEIFHNQKEKLFFEHIIPLSKIYISEIV